ncbi:MAG TPA: hypothetical protein HPQ00_06865 [Magnetococcales bacterium]|nr:hypothetical protein [Magnetococcales bacterium]
MTDKPKQMHRLQDYQPPPFLVKSVDLHFKPDPESTLVDSRLVFVRNPDFPEAPPPHLRLDGKNLELLSLTLGSTPHANRVSSNRKYHRRKTSSCRRP